MIYTFCLPLCLSLSPTFLLLVNLPISSVTIVDALYIILLFSIYQQYKMFLIRKSNEQQHKTLSSSA